MRDDTASGLRALPHRLLVNPLRLPTPALVTAAFLACVLLLQWPLLFNPGYFSHDELQWAVFATAHAPAGWRQPEVFQYRPLTFTLWMALSRGLFATPMLFHAVLVAWGTANAGLLLRVGRGFGMRAWPARLGALVFACGPFAALVHGWVGCIADLLWLTCALLLALCVQRLRQPWWAALAALLLTSCALLAKEAAFALPPLLLLAWWLDGRRRTWLAALLASTLACALYLAVRWQALLHAPRMGAQYTLDIAHVPLRWLEYQLFAPLLPALETYTSLQWPGLALLAGALWLWLVQALCRAGRRWALLFLLGGVAALLPALPLAASWNQYGYGFAALGSMVVAAAWPQASRWARSGIVLFAVLTLAHGGLVMWRIREVGRLQAVFSPALARAVAQHPGTLVVRPVAGAKAWVFRRLTHDIPAYDGVPIGTRVRLVEGDAPADMQIEADGQLRPLP